MANKRKRPQKPNATGRTPTGRFVRLDHRMLNSNAYRSLSPNARSLLTELIMLYNGENNGSLYLSVEDAAHRMGVSDHHAGGRAFHELQERGFIEMTRAGHFSIKASHTSRARTWRLTWEAGPGRKAPSWRDNEPEPGTPQRKRMERGLRALKRYRKNKSQEKLPVVDSTMVEHVPGEPRLEAVVESTMLKSTNGGNPSICCMGDSHHHTATTMGSTDITDNPRRIGEVGA